MDHTIKKVMEVAHRAGLEVAVWQASPDTAGMLAAAVGALLVGVVPGGLAGLAGGPLPPRRLRGGNGE
jgi:hypothetical protein